MTPAAHYRMFGHYNAWANDRLYDAAAQLSIEQYRADRGAFFKSVHGTLNHLLVTDRIWMQRFTGEGDAPDRLDAILFGTFEELRAAREAEDKRTISYVDGLDDDLIAGTIKYWRVSSPEQFEQQLAPALAHWSNHQTHHRGQVPYPPDRDYRRSAGARSVVFPACRGQTAFLAVLHKICSSSCREALKSRNLHYVACSVAVKPQLRPECGKLALWCFEFGLIC